MTQREMTEAFILKKDAELKQKTINFCAEILKLELAIKEIKQQIKDTKEMAKSEGVAIKEISKTLGVMKKERKMTEKDKQEIAEMLDFLESNETISQMINDLIL